VQRVQPHLSALRERSARRVSAGKDFAFLREEVALAKKATATKTLSLNEAERRKEMAEAKARRELREKEAKSLRASAPTTYEITLKNSANAGLPAPVAIDGKTAQNTQKEKGKKDGGDGLGGKRSPLEEIILQESVQILADYVGLLKGQPPTSTPNAERLEKSGTEAKPRGLGQTPMQGSKGATK
jgi:carboxyl-terminal processing protease